MANESRLQAALKDSPPVRSPVRGAASPVWSPDRPQRQRFVQAAQTVSLEIDGDVAVAKRPERTHEVVGDRRVERAGHFLAGNLESRDRVVMAHAKHAEASLA